MICPDYQLRIGSGPVHRALLLVLLLLGLSSATLAWSDEDVAASFVTQAYIEMRTQPGRGYPVFYVAERGERIELLKQRTDWIKVRKHHNRGIFWKQKNYITMAMAIGFAWWLVGERSDG